MMTALQLFNRRLRFRRIRCRYRCTLIAATRAATAMHRCPPIWARRDTVLSLNCEKANSIVKKTRQHSWHGSLMPPARLPINRCHYDTHRKHRVLFYGELIECLHSGRGAKSLLLKRCLNSQEAHRSAQFAGATWTFVDGWSAQSTCPKQPLARALTMGHQCAHTRD